MPWTIPTSYVLRSLSPSSGLTAAIQLSAPYAFSLCITLRDGDDLPNLLDMFLEAGLPHVEDTHTKLRNETEKQLRARQITFVRKKIYSRDNLDRCGRWIERKEFVLAFQIEALVRNVLIDPVTLVQLSIDVDNVLAQYPTASAQSDIIRQWAALIRENGVPRGVLLSDKKLLMDLLNRARLENERLLSKLPAKKKKKQGVTYLGKELLPRIFDQSAFLCHHVAVTPTAVHLEGPFPVLSNRVLRKYPDHPHHFIRVHFTDEEHHQFRWQREVDGRKFVREHVGDILKGGLRLAGRHFEFLAYSFGALKEHTVWFVTPFYVDLPGGGRQEVNAHSIRASLGDFSKVINSPSMCVGFPLPNARSICASSFY